MNYEINTGFEDGTTVRIETTNRELFFRIEEIINKFRFRNEEPNGIELAEEFQNEECFRNESQNIIYLPFGNEESDGIELEKQDGNGLKEENNNKYLSKTKKTTHPDSISTKWGNAYIDKDGHYKISSMKYRGKALHRLIYEDYHKCTVIYGHIHHIDGNKTNNNPENLVLLTPSEHFKITKDMIKYGNRKETPLIPRINDNKYWEYSNRLSKEKNTTGYLHVYKQVCPKCSQGFTWKYTWRENGKVKTLESTNIKKLEAKVRAKGLPWQKL